MNKLKHIEKLVKILNNKWINTPTYYVDPSGSPTIKVGIISSDGDIPTFMRGGKEIECNMLNNKITLPTPVAHPYIARVYYDIDNGKFDYAKGVEAAIPSPPELPDGNFVDVFALPINVDTSIGEVIQTTGLKAKDIPTDTTNFGKNLTKEETDLQKVIDKLDDLSTGHIIESNGVAVTPRDILNFSSDFIVIDSGGKTLVKKNIIREGAFYDTNVSLVIPIIAAETITNIQKDAGVNVVQYSVNEGINWYTFSTNISCSANSRLLIKVISFNPTYSSGSVRITSNLT